MWHPAVGELTLTFESFRSAADPDISLIAYTAEPGSPSEAALRTLADARSLDCADPACAKLSDDARSCLADWVDSGWIHYRPE
jgi:50S ribosomal protein L16 3-hydroxylase